MSSWIARAAGAALLLGCVGAEAGALPRAAGNIWYSGNTSGNGKSDQFGYSGGWTTILTDSLMAKSDVLPMSSAIQVAGLPSISLAAGGGYDGRNDGFLAAGAALDYRFEVGGTPGAIVPVTFNGWLSINETVVNQSSVVVAVGTDSGSHIDLRIDAMGGSSPEPTIPASVNFDELAPAPTYSDYPSQLTFRGAGQTHFSGTVYATLDASGHMQGSVDLRANLTSTMEFPASIYVDPQLQIDANWLAAHPAGAALTLPDGVGNAAPVPEPASWLLAAAGGLVLAARARRRPVPPALS